MRVDDFRKHVKEHLFDVQKVRGLEVLRISEEGETRLDITYADIYPIGDFMEWLKTTVLYDWEDYHEWGAMPPAWL